MSQSVWGNPVCVYIYICIYVCMHIYIYICTCIYIYMCMYICMNVLCNMCFFTLISLHVADSASASILRLVLRGALFAIIHVF